MSSWPSCEPFSAPSRRSIEPLSSDLSARELDVLELAAEGLTNEAIAGRLSLSVRTVERHLSNIYVKVGVSGKAGRAAASAQYSRLRAGRQTTRGGLRGGTDAGDGRRL